MAMDLKPLDVLAAVRDHGSSAFRALTEEYPREHVEYHMRMGWEAGYLDSMTTPALTDAGREWLQGAGR